MRALHLPQWISQKTVLQEVGQPGEQQQRCIVDLSLAQHFLSQK
jgi:hypothetical protein